MHCFARFIVYLFSGCQFLNSPFFAIWNRAIWNRACLFSICGFRIWRFPVCHFRTWVLLVCMSSCAGALSGTAWAESALININAATAAELAKHLPGIGPAKSRAIVEYRHRNGPFVTIDELEKVKGIGPATMNKLRRLLTVDQSFSQRSIHNNSAVASRVTTTVKAGSVGSSNRLNLTTNTDSATREQLPHHERATRHAVQAAIAIARRAAAGVQN